MKNYRTLDAIVVCVSLAMLAGVLYALVMVKIPETQLPIVAGLAGTIFGGTIGAYAGARWASKTKPDEPHAPGDVQLSLTASGGGPVVDPEVTR